MIELVLSIRLIRENQEFKANIAIVKGDLEKLELNTELLHEKEMEIYKSFKHDRRKKSYLLGRLSAKKVLMSLTETQISKLIWIDSGIFNFPVIKCQNIHNTQLSISHCDDIGMSIAFPEVHPMAIDLERIDRNHLTGILSQITENEKLLLRGIHLENVTGYTLIWTVKEALSKIIKTGMMIDFKLLEIEHIVIENDFIKCTFFNFRQYKVISILTGQTHTFSTGFYSFFVFKDLNLS